MDFLVYSRSTPAAAGAGHDGELDEQHWSYLDRFADGMTARGPTLAADRETWTGSLHVLDLPGPDAAREFVANEPYNRAGLFEANLIWRFTNLLGHAMWQFAGVAAEPRFLVLAQAIDDRVHNPAPAPLGELPAELRRRLIVYGQLHDVDEQSAVGVALAVQVPARAVLDELLADHRSGLGRFGDVTIHDWEFGGRR